MPVDPSEVNATIFIAESDPATGEDIAQRIRELGYAAAGPATTAAEVEVQARAARPDLVLMDIVLALDVYAGESADGMIRKIGAPVIFMAAPSDLDRLEQIGPALPYGHLVKPVGNSSLSLAVESALTVLRIENGRKEVDEELDRYRRIISSSTDSMALVGPDYRYRIVNETYEYYSGLKKEQIVGTGVGDYLGPDVFESLVKERLDRCLAGETVNYRAWFEFRRLGHRFMDTTYSPYAGASGQVEDVLVISRDITDLQKTEDSRREAEALFRQLFDNMTNGVAVYRPVDGGRDFVFVDINPAGQALSQVRAEDVIGKKLGDIFPLVDEFGLLDILRKVSEDGRPRHLPLKLYEDGRIREMVENKVFRLPSGLVVALYEDTSEREQMIEALRESEERYRTVVESAPWSIIVAQDGKLAFTNEAAAKILGLDDPEELVGMPALQVIGEESKAVLSERLQRLDAGLVNEPAEIDIVRRDGSVIPIESVSVPFVLHGRRAALIFAQDISDRKAAERELLTSLEEKNILLREVHHRVRNNLQVLTSLTNLEARRKTNPEALEVIKTTRSRVEAMARAHELLYRSDLLGSIDFREYARKLMDSVVENYGSGRDTVGKELDIRPGLTLNIDKALPCGLAINELLTNSLKHAFEPGAPGKVFIRVKKTRNEMEVIVGDNGRGIPEGLDFRKTDSLGLTLVSGLIERQLRGRIELEGDGGTVWTLAFPL